MDSVEPANETKKEPEVATATQERKRAKPRPTEVLPTDRIAFPKQLKLLIAYAAIHEQTGGAVSNEQAGEVVGLSAGTTSLANAFFSDIGFLTRADGGYRPNSDVVAYRRMQEWTASDFARELAPSVNNSWFAKALIPKLAVGPLSEQDALSELSKRANAGPQYRAQLRTLIDYLVATELVERNGDQLRRGPVARPEETRKERPEKKPPPRAISDLHPFIEGLLLELPSTGSVWPEVEQQAWLDGWKVAFRFLYKTESNPDEVRLSLTPSSDENPAGSDSSEAHVTLTPSSKEGRND